MVGRRLEARERVAAKATTSAAVDPLAALDELGADEKADEELAFPVALSGKAGEASLPEPKKDKPAAPAAAADKPAPAPEKSPAAPAADKTAPASPAPDKADKKRFTLQISSFQDKSEADALVAKLTSAGYKPYVILSDVEGKGTFFRVRIGEYKSKGDATSAKETFEKKQKLIAYVMKM